MDSIAYHWERRRAEIREWAQMLFVRNKDPWLALRQAVALSDGEDHFCVFEERLWRPHG